MKNALVLLTLLALVSLSGCVSTTLPGAENVHYTEDPKDISGCKMVGGQIPGGQLGHRLDLGETAIQAGADTVLYRKVALGARVANLYNCTGVDTRQPVPVSVSK